MADSVERDEAQRQSLAAAAADSEADDQAFVDAVAVDLDDSEQGE